MKKIKNCFKILFVAMFLMPIAFLLSACGAEGGSNDEGDAEVGLQTFSEVSFVDANYDYDGEEHEIVVGGVLPQDVHVEYSGNKGVNAGEYFATATLSLEGYKTLTLHAKLTINKLNYDMSNAKWNYVNPFEYDGTEKRVIVEGLPDGVAVKSYSDNKATNAGKYCASVEFDYDETNHNKPTISQLDWEINKATYDMSEVCWDYTSPFTYDGSEKVVQLVNLPDGVTVKSYTNNRQTASGNYVATATLNYDALNYNEISVPSCSWKIKQNVSSLGLKILSNLMNVPDPWSFLPDSFSVENKRYVGDTNIDLTNFVEVSTLPKVGIGKQMNVVYSTLFDVETALSYLRGVYGSFNVIVDLYQTFINENENNYAMFEKKTENFTFKIEVSENDYSMTILYKSAIIDLTYASQTQKCSGRIQLSNSNVIKYEMSNNDLTIASNVVGIALTKLHFERNNNQTEGYLYEYYGTETKNIKTSALININSDYTTIISNKRETDDLQIEGCMEIYRNTDACLVGIEVRETVKDIKYETSWFNIWDIENIDTIKVVDEQNKLNMNTIYINNNSNPIQTKLVGGVSLKMASRRFDIEMKDLYVYVYDETNEKYNKVQINLPMLFIQNEFIEEFEDDFYSKNASNGAIKPTKLNIANADSEFMFKEYAQLIDQYSQLKTKITYQSILDYIGIRESS